MIDQNTFKFMKDLYGNNNKEWFDENRKRYEKFVRDPMKSLSNSLAGPVSTILPEFSGKAKISRINNDLRFNPKKPPYKEHVWVSFGKSTRDNTADIFAAFSKEGWCAGCGLDSPKRGDLDNWRLNLVKHIDTWNKYWDRLNSNVKIETFTNNPYKKPVFNDTPEEVVELVQSRGTWLVSKPVTKFKKSPEEDLFSYVSIMLPIFLFMTVTPADLPNRLAELGDVIVAPNKEVEKYWSVLSK